MTAYQTFKKLHTNNEPFFLGNVWNVQSAGLYEESGYKALGTSSSAIARTLGYEDGEQMTFNEYFYSIERIKKSTSIPLSVDLEAGYGETSEQIVSNIMELVSIGVVGVNIEDSVVIDGIRKILNKKEFYQKLKPVMEKLKENDIEIFINIRTDTFLLGVESPLSETLERIKIFEELGADGIFIPCLASEKDIRIITEATEMPVNIMTVSGLPDYEKLTNLGVKRISTGNFVNEYIYKYLKNIAGEIITEQNYSLLFS